MVLDFQVKIPMERVKISRVLILSGLLTFLYLIELCIGIRTVYYAFSLWTSAVPRDFRDAPVSWALCLSSLLLAVGSTFAVNLVSAMWENKQLKEEEKEQSVLRFSFHIIVGGMIWRYISLWYSDKKELLKRSALLLTMTKFLFTQSFTVPLVIVHFGVLSNLDEIILDACSVLCVSINLLLTCTMFRWCAGEVEELKKWDYETVDLVPLIFQRSTPTRRRSTVDSGSTEKQIESEAAKKSGNCRNNAEMALLNFTVLCQTFGFSFGRLLALGVLLKLAGIYAVSIMFLQLLISVIYLKFQAPVSIPETLPKWRQLVRLGFLSYILIFEWHLNRHPKTGFDFRSNMKHSMLYYCIATVESVFYLVTWAITASYSTSPDLSDMNDPKHKFVRSLITMGSLSLIFSFTLHIILLFWKSRKVFIFIGTVRRRCYTVKLRLSRYGSKGEPKTADGQPELKCPHIDISSPIPIHKNETADRPQTEEEGELQATSSYRDLRDPVDEEIEIYVRNKTNSARNSHVANGRQCSQIPENCKENEESDDQTHSARQSWLHVGKFQTFGGLGESEDCEDAATIPTTPTNGDNCKPAASPGKEAVDSQAESASPGIRSKTAMWSESLSRQWNKFSLMSRRLTDTMQEKIQKKREQFQTFRSGASVETKSEPSQANVQPQEMHDDVTAVSPEVARGIKPDYTEDPDPCIDASEGYFIGDDRCHEPEGLQSVTVLSDEEDGARDPKPKTGKPPEGDDEDSINEDDSDSAPKHREGDSPCPCYICKTLGDARFRRRRSSSVPPEVRKIKSDADSSFKEVTTISHCISNPNLSGCKVVYSKAYENQLKNAKYHNSTRSKVLSKLSVASLDRVEHYV